MTRTTSPTIIVKEQMPNYRGAVSFNVRADESWGTTATQLIAPRLTQFFILYSLLLVLHRLNPLVSPSRKGLKCIYAMGVVVAFLSHPGAR